MKALWKTTYIATVQHTRDLASCWASSWAAYGPGKTFTVEGPLVETDLAWQHVRDVFRFAAVPFPSLRNKWVTDTMSTEERYRDDGAAVLLG